MDDTPATPQPKRPRRARTVGEVSAGDAAAKVAGNGASSAAEPTPIEVKQGFVVLQGESMPDAELASLELRQGAIGRVDATDVTVSQGAVGGARAERVAVSQGALGGALAGEVTITQGGAGTIIARAVRVEQSVVGRMIAQEVRVEKPSAVMFLLAQRVSGDIRVLFDWKSALALGGAIGLVSGVVQRIARRNG